LGRNHADGNIPAGIAVVESGMVITDIELAVGSCFHEAEIRARLKSESRSIE